MNCKKAQNMLLEYLDDDLAIREQNEIKTHLNQCRQCKDELKVWENLKQELISDILPSPAPGYWERLARRTLSELAEKPQPLFRPIWRTGLVLAGILILIINVFWFSGKPEEITVQTEGNGEVWNETVNIELVAFTGLAELNTTELEEVADELTDEDEATEENDVSYPQNAYYESVQELNNEEIEILLEDQTFIQPLTGENYHELL